MSNLFRELAPKIVAEDFTPVFTLGLLHKDNRLAVRMIEDLGLPPLLGHSVDVINTLALRAGHGDDDTAAVYRLFGCTATRHRATGPYAAESTGAGLAAAQTAPRT